MAQTTSTSLPTVGEVILAWRKAKELSSTQLANKAGVRIAYLSEIEHNKTQYPREEYLEKLALALGLELADIYARRMPMEDEEAGQTSRTQQDKEEGDKKAAIPSTVYQTPLALKHQKILLHRLEVLEKKVEAEKKHINDLHEAICELKAIVVDMIYEG